MLGAIIGDMCGSVYEFTKHKGKDFNIFENNNVMTDDSLLTIEVARVLLNNFPIKYDQKSLNKIKCELKNNFSNLVRKMPDVGWGSMFYDWALGYYRNNFEPYNSFGNGAGMRISPVGWFANSEDEVKILSKCITEITHNHIEGILGAEAIAMSIFMALHGKTKDEIANYIIENYYPSIKYLDYEGLVKNYRFDVTCQGSVPQAIYCFLISNSFEDAIKTAISIGGDTDTIACMAGAIAEAYYLNDKDTTNFINKFIIKYNKEFAVNSNMETISQFYDKIKIKKQ